MNNPPAVNRGADVQPGGLDVTPILTQNPTPPPEPALIGASVEKALNATLWRLLAGEVTLNDLTISLQGFYVAGHTDGRAELQPRLNQLSAENERLYLRAYNKPDKVAEIVQRRLSGHFEAEAARFFREAANV